MKKKRWLSMLLAAIMALTLLPMTALAAAPSVDIDGTYLQEGENSIGGGTAILNTTEGTLTLDNVAVTSHIWISGSPLTVSVKGNSSVGSQESPSSEVALWNNTDLTIQIEQGATLSLYTEGSNNVYTFGGSLTVSGPGKLIGNSVSGGNGAFPNLCATNDITLNDNLTAELFSEWHGVYTEKGNIAVQSSAVTINAAGIGLFAQTYDPDTDSQIPSSLTLTDSTVTIDTSSGDRAAVFCGSGGLVVENTVLDTTTDKDPDLGGYSLYSNGDVTIRGAQTRITADDGQGIYAGETLSIEGGNISIASSSVALLGWYGVSITGGTVQATAEEDSAILGRDGPVSITGSADVTATNHTERVATIRNYSDGGIFLDAPVTANNTQGGKPFLGVKSDKGVAITFGDGFSASGTEVYTSEGESWLIPAGGEGGTPLTGQVFVCAHVWGKPVWNWAKDYSSATATFTCSKDPTHTQAVTATITSQTTDSTCGKDGQTVYTASVSFEGATYTDQKTVVIPATGKHTYSNGKCTVCGASAYTNPLYPTKPSKPNTAAGLNKPSGSKEDVRNDENPNTGNSGVEGLQLVLMLASAAALAGVVDYSRKRKYSK